MAEEEKSGKSEISLLPDNASTEDIKYKPKISLFRALIEKHYAGRLRLNEMTGKPEYKDADTGEWREWTDAHDSQMRAYFQQSYGLYSPKMLDDALQIHFMSNTVNPVLNMLEALEWDGKPRVERMLIDVMKCDDTPYIRECSRLIFAGGINRIYDPGCKFDDMVVLIGDQGCGKSTLAHWLAMDEKYFREIKTITGKEGIEALRGCWIGEVAELMAMTRVKETEAVKAYITTQADSYRPPYARHVVTVPRRCVFIGTTNNHQFLTDRTGNRRFYPVPCDHSDGKRLQDAEAEVRPYLAQCWAEAVQMYKAGNLKPYANYDIIDQIKAAQANAMEDDYRIGMIEQYLEDTKKKPNSTVSVIELWHQALNQPSEVKPTRKDSIEITQIMEGMGGWYRRDGLMRTAWGPQRVFIKRDIMFPL